MKRSLLAIVLSCVCSAVIADSDMEIMRRSGLRAKVVIVLKDFENKPVPNAIVKFTFRANEDVHEYSSVTDSDGRAMAEARANLDVIVNCQKTGYYPLRFSHTFLTRDATKMSNGCWVPYENVFNLRIREVRNPNRTEFQSVFIDIPETNVFYGVNLRTKSLEKTSGKAKDPVLLFRFENVRPEHANDKYLQKFTLSTFTNTVGCGFMFVERLSDGFLAYPYQFPEIGYTNSVLLWRGYLSESFSERMIETKKEALAFKIGLTEQDEYSPATNVFYGMITRIGFFKRKTGGLLELCYYLNETPGDRNSEYTR